MYKNKNNQYEVLRLYGFPTHVRQIIVTVICIVIKLTFYTPYKCDVIDYK